MEVNNLSDVSHPAFSQQDLNEKSKDYPTITPSSPEINPLKAMLTSDGSIKIIVTESDESSADEENCKESSHSQDSGNEKEETSISSSKISKSTNFTSSYDTSTIRGEEEDDDDEFSQYKQSPRAVFLSTVCHVSEKFLMMKMNKNDMKIFPLAILRFAKSI